MLGLKKVLCAAATAVVAVGMVAATATATHINVINDGTDPNSTIGPNGQHCSVDAVTPSGNYTVTLGDYVYRLRYSANCRSVWARSLNNAPKRNDMVAHRHSSPTYCASGINNGDTYTWTNQVDDAGHLSNIHVNNSGYNGCADSGAIAWTSLF
jgi:hypothetical protein